MYTIDCRPNLGAKAFAAGWYFNFNLAYVGAGFITPISVGFWSPNAFRCLVLDDSTLASPVQHLEMFHACCCPRCLTSFCQSD